MNRRELLKTMGALCVAIPTIGTAREGVKVLILESDRYDHYYGTGYAYVDGVLVGQWGSHRGWEEIVDVLAQDHGVVTVMLRRSAKGYPIYKNWSQVMEYEKQKRAASEATMKRFNLDHGEYDPVLGSYKIEPMVRVRYPNNYMKS